MKEIANKHFIRQGMGFKWLRMGNGSLDTQHLYCRRIILGKCWLAKVFLAVDDVRQLLQEMKVEDTLVRWCNSHIFTIERGQKQFFYDYLKNYKEFGI